MEKPFECVVRCETGHISVLSSPHPAHSLIGACLAHIATCSRGREGAMFAVRTHGIHCFYIRREGGVERCPLPDMGRAAFWLSVVPP